jgi:hypothetical protein
VKRALAVVLGLAVALIGTVAVAAWLSSGSGAAMATATSVAQANAPTATPGAGTVTLTWAASTLTNGAPVSGYKVLRHDGATTTQVCAVSALTCDDTSPVATHVTYGVVATIGANWTGPESPTTSFTYDNVAPSPPVFTAISNDTGSSNSDRVTNVASQNLLGTAEAGSSVTVKKGVTAVCTVTANGSGVFTCPVTLASGANVYTATATDQAGNTSSTSANFTVTLDQATATPTFTAISNDTGSSISDQVTNVASQNLLGSAEANSSVTVKKGATTVCIVTATGSGSFTCPATLSSGSNVYTATATDLAGNTASSVNFAVTLDQTAPGAPAFTGISNDTGSSTSDQITNVAAQNLLGTAEANSTVTVTRGGSTICTVTATSGAFSCPIALNSGANVFTAVATDLAGNGSATSTTFTVTLDQATATPTFTGISDDTGGSSSDQITKTAVQNLLGTAEAGSSVAIKKGQGAPVCTATANSSGVFSCTVTLAVGANVYTATATDIAGNSSSQSATFTVTLDNTAPVIGTIEPGNESGGWTAIACSVSANVGKPCAGVTDNLAMGSMTMTLTKSGGRCWDGTSNSNFVAGNCPVVNMSLVSGVWAPANSLLRSTGNAAAGFTDTSYTLAITATDTAGNTATQSRTFTVSGS